MRLHVLLLVLAALLKQSSAAEMNKSELDPLNGNLTEVDYDRNETLAEAEDFLLDAFSSDLDKSATTNHTRPKRTLSILSRFYCTLFYRGAIDDCPVGRRFRPEAQAVASPPTQDDFWLNYLTPNSTNTTDEFTSTTEYYPPPSTQAPGIFRRKFNWIRRRFRNLFPRMYVTLGGRDIPEETNNGMTLWQRIVDRFTRLRNGYRGFRAGYRGDDEQRTSLDLSSLLSNVDVGGILGALGGGGNNGV